MDDLDALDSETLSTFLLQTLPDAKQAHVASPLSPHSVFIILLSSYIADRQLELYGLFSRHCTPIWPWAIADRFCAHL
jgi:hypothetical protein